MEAEEDEKAEKSEYFYRLIHLVVDLGTEMLLKLFKKDIPQGQTVAAFLNIKANMLTSLKTKNVFNNLQIGILNATPPDMSRFDISLLYILICNLTNIDPPIGGWKQASPIPSDRSARALLMNFRLVRNEAIAHWPRCTMNKSVFEMFWKRTENILVSLADEISQTEKVHAKEMIEKIKTRQLSEDQRWKLNTQILGKVQEDIDLLKQKMVEQENKSEDEETRKLSLEILEVKLKDLENNMKKFDDISRKVDQQNDISADVDNMKTSIKNMETKLQGLKTDMSKCDDITIKVDQQIDLLDTTKTSVNNLETKVQGIKSEVDQQSDISDTMKTSVNNLETNVQGLKSEVDEHDSRLHALEDQSKGQEDQFTFPAVKKVNDQMKHYMQKELADHYNRNGYCKTTITAFIDDEEIDIEQLFVEPIMKRVKYDSFSKASRDKNEENDSKSRLLLKDIFKEDGRVCVSGNAGEGKTALCQMIVSSWCKIHVKGKHEPHIYEQFLKPFDYLFYIPLRNHSISDVDEMIETGLVREASHGVLKEVLKYESEKCLIILDGLDEWMPLNDCKVPYIDPREKFTVLITSRPWKLEVLRPKMSEIGQEITMCGIDEDRIVKGMVKLLNKKYGTDKNYRGFTWKLNKHNENFLLKKNEQYEKVKHLARIPIILTHMVCLWYDGEKLGDTRIEVYCKILEYLFNMAFKRDQKEGGKQTLMDPQRSAINAKLINVFKGCRQCEDNSELLSKLSVLAFHTLFNERKENSIVFLHSVTEFSELYKLTGNDVTFCLSVGILSQSKVSGKASSQLKKLSFLHKTVQEFLAALFIAYGEKDTSFHLMLKTLISLDDVLEMSQMLIFLSALKPTLLQDISRHVSQLTDKDERVLQFRSTLLKGNSFISSIHDIIRACIDEVPKDMKIDFKVVLNDYFTIDEQMIPYLDLENVKSFSKHKGCNVWTELSGHDIVKLCLRVESQEHICHLTSIVERCVLPLTCLSISGTSLCQNVSLNDLLVALNKACHLRCLGISTLKLTHSDIENLGGLLSHKTELREIILESINCATCELGRCNYRIDISQHKQLQNLKIQNLYGEFVMSDEVPLKHCFIRDIECDGSIINRLKLSASLQKLHICGFPSTVHSVGEDNPSQLCLYRVLIDVIPTLKYLKQIELYSIDFKQDILKLSPDMTSLKLVSLYSCTMTLQCLQGFIDSLPQTQFKVTMMGVCICPKYDESTAVNYIIDRCLDVCNLLGESMKPIKGDGDHTYRIENGSTDRGEDDHTDRDEDGSITLNFSSRPHQ